MQNGSKKSPDEASATLAKRIQRVENGILPTPINSQPQPRFTIQKLMELYKVPGVSIAVIDDFDMAWAKGYGVAEVGTSTPVTPRTLFQSGSVSKAVAATGALILVQEGKFQLDEDVNQKLRTWKVP